MTKLIAIDFGDCVCVVRAVEGELPGHDRLTRLFTSMDEVRSLIGKPETRIEKYEGCYMVFTDGKVLTPNGLAESTYNALCKIAGRELAWKGGEWRRISGDVGYHEGREWHAVNLPFEVWEYSDE